MTKQTVPNKSPFSWAPRNIIFSLDSPNLSSGASYMFLGSDHFTGHMNLILLPERPQASLYH